MTLKVDGTNGVLQAYDYQVLTTGFSYTFASGTQTLVINPADTLATGTVTMPAAPVDGMVVTIESTQQVTALTVAGNTGQTMTNGAITLRPNQPVSYMYRLSNTTWYPYAGATNSQTISGTAVVAATGSPTYIDFTGIPSWAKIITVSLSSVSTNGNNALAFQIGDSGGIESTGYYGSTSYITSGVSTAVISNAASFSLNAALSTYSVHGTCTFTLVDSATNNWAATASFSSSSAAVVMFFSGSKALSGTLDRVRITTTTGTDTFDAGLVNILYA